MYEEVLLPVTYGEADTDPAIDRAVDLARTYGATLHVVSVVDPTMFHPLTSGGDQIATSVSDAAEATLDRVADRARSAGLSVVTHLGRGAPSDGITAYARDNDIDVIVMATHGREGLDRTLLGSVTEKVIRRSETPVLTVPFA